VGVVNIVQTRVLALIRLFILFALTGLVEAKSSITSPIQEALRDPLIITEL